MRREQYRHCKSDERSEKDPPRKFHYRQPAGLGVELRSKDSCDVVRQTAQDRHHKETDNHGDDVAAIVPAGLG